MGGAGIIIWKGKAYLPCYDRYKSGIGVQVEPVYVADLNVPEILSAIKKVLSHKQALLRDPSPEAWKKRKDPLLAATGARSWLELARKGHGYGIEWIKEGIEFTVSRRDKKGRWETDPGKVRIYPNDTPLEEIIAAILEDLKSQSEISQLT